MIVILVKMMEPALLMMKVIHVHVWLALLGPPAAYLLPVSLLHTLFTGSFNHGGKRRRSYKLESLIMLIRFSPFDKFQFIRE